MFLILVYWIYINVEVFSEALYMLKFITCFRTRLLIFRKQILKTINMLNKLFMRIKVFIYRS